MSPEQDLAEQLKDYINANVTLPESVQAKRLYKPKQQLTETGVEKISVVAQTIKMVERLSRGEVRYEITIDVALQKRMSDPADVDQGDALSDLVNSIRETLIENEFAGMIDDEPFELDSFDSNPLWNSRHLEEWHQFTNVTSYTFTGSAER